MVPIIENQEHIHDMSEYNSLNGLGLNSAMSYHAMLLLQFQRDSLQTQPMHGPLRAPDAHLYIPGPGKLPLLQRQPQNSPTCYLFRKHKK